MIKNILKIIIILALFAGTASAIQVVASNTNQSVNLSAHNSSGADVSINTLASSTGTINVSYAWTRVSYNTVLYLLADGVPIGDNVTAQVSVWSGTKTQTISITNISKISVGCSASCGVENFRLMYDLGYYHTYHVDSIDGMNMNGFTLFGAGLSADLSHGDIRSSTGGTRYISNSTVTTDEFLFDLTRISTASSVDGLMFGQNTTSYKQIRYNQGAVPPAWEVYCFSTSCDGGAGVKASYPHIVEINTTYRVRVHFYSYKNSTVDILNLNNSLIGHMSWNNSLDFGSNLTQYYGTREGAGSAGGIAIDNLAYNIPDNSYSENFEASTGNLTTLSGSFNRIQDNGNWVLINNKSTTALVSYLNTTYFSNANFTMDVNYSGVINSDSYFGLRLYAQEPAVNQLKNHIFIYYNPYSSLIYIGNRVNTTVGTTFSASSVSTSANSTLRFKSKIVGTQVLAKIYPITDIEPGWQVISNDSNFSVGFFEIVNNNLTTEFDNLSVIPSDELFIPVANDGCSFSSNTIYAWGNSTTLAELKSCLDNSYSPQNYLTLVDGTNYSLNANLDYNGTDDFYVTDNIKFSSIGDYRLRTTLGRLHIDNVTLYTDNTQPTYGKVEIENQTWINNSIFNGVHLKTIYPNSSIYNLTISNAYDSVDLAMIDVLYGSEGTIFTNITAYKSGSYAAFRIDDRIIINNSYINMTGGHGGYNGAFYLTSNSINTVIDNNIIDSNYDWVSTSNSVSGIWCEYCSNTTFTNNILNNIGWVNYFISSPNLIMSNNTFNISYNIDIIDSQYVQIRNNTFKDNRWEDVIIPQNMSNSIIDSNIIYPSMFSNGNGMYLNGGSYNLTVSNNYIATQNKLYAYNYNWGGFSNQLAGEYILESGGVSGQNIIIRDPQNEIVFINTYQTTTDEIGTLEYSDNSLFIHRSRYNISYIYPTNSSIQLSGKKSQALKIQKCSIHAVPQTVASFEVNYCDMNYINRTNLSITSIETTNNILFTVNTTYSNILYDIYVDGTLLNSYDSGFDNQIEFNYSNFTILTHSFQIQKRETKTVWGYGGIPFSNLTTELNNVTIIDNPSNEFWNRVLTTPEIQIGANFYDSFDINTSSNYSISEDIDWINGNVTSLSNGMAIVSDSNFSNGWLEMGFVSENGSIFSKPKMGIIFDYVDSNNYNIVEMNNPTGSSFISIEIEQVVAGIKTILANSTTSNAILIPPGTSSILRININNSIVETYIQQGNELLYNARNISLIRPSGQRKIGFNITNNSQKQDITYFKAWNDIEHMPYGGVIFNSSGIQMVKYIGFGSVDLERWNGTAFTSVQTDAVSGQDYNFQNTTQAKIILRSNDSRIQSLILTEDNISPLSITENSTSKGNFWINNTWTKPTDIDLDYTAFYYANGTWIINVSAGTEYLNLTYSPHAVQNISAQTVDSSGNINETKIWFNATIANNAPEITSPYGGSRTVEEDTEISFTITASDLDNDTLTYSITGNGVINSSTGVYTWTPTTPGTYYVSLYVNDAYGGSDYETDQIIVTAYVPPNYRLSGLVVPSGSTISVTGQDSLTGGSYDFGQTFLAGYTYWVNVSHTGYTSNNSQITFGASDMIYNVTLIEIPVDNSPPIIESWGNNFTNNESLNLFVERNQSVMFNVTANQTLTGCTWTTAIEINQTGPNCYADYNFTVAGLKSVSVYGTNGSLSTAIKTWDITVNETYPTITPPPGGNITINATQWQELNDKVDASYNFAFLSFILGILGAKAFIVLRKKDLV